MHHFLKRFTFAISRLFSKNETKERIELFPSGFRLICDGQAKGEVLWNQVNRIAAFKDDLLTVDLICMEFILREKDIVFEVNEDIEGFWDLAKRLPTIYPSINREWQSKVVLPPFARNPTTIYQRAD